MANGYQVRVLNGPLAGRVVRLPQGETRIGGADPDLAVALEQNGSATLTVDDDGIRLATTAPCWIDGARVAPPERIPLGQVIDLGGLGLVFGQDDIVQRGYEMPARKTSHRQRYVLRALAVAGLVTGVVSALPALGWMLSPAASAPVFNQRDWLAQQARGLAADGVSLKDDGQGVLELSGQCRDSTRLNALRRALQERGIVYRDQTICQDQLVRNVSAALKMNGYQDAVVTDGAEPGSVDIAGRIEADERWRRVTEILSAMPGLRHWSVRDNANESVGQLIERLRAANLVGRLSVARSGDRLLVTGQLSAAEKKALDDVLAGFARQYPAAPKVLFQAIPSAATQSGIFPAPVVSFGGSREQMFLELANGMRVKRGSWLPSGYQITGLDPNGVDLVKDGQLTHLPLNL